MSVTASALPAGGIRGLLPSWRVPYPLDAVLQPQLAPHGLLLLEELLERLRERRRRRDLRAQAGVRAAPLWGTAPPKCVLATEGQGYPMGCLWISSAKEKVLPALSEDEDLARTTRA